MLSQYFHLLFNFSFKVEQLQQTKLTEHVQKTLYVKQNLKVAKLHFFQKRWTECMASSRKTAQSSTWSMEDTVFHTLLSALISIYTERIMIHWCKSSWKKSRTQGCFHKFGVLVLRVLYYRWKKSARLARYWG